MLLLCVDKRPVDNPIFQYTDIDGSQHAPSLEKLHASCLCACLGTVATETDLSDLSDVAAGA